MAKRRQSRKQREASLKNLRKARRSRKIKGEGKPRKTRRASRRRQSAKQRAASLKNLAKGRRKARKSRKAGPEKFVGKRHRHGRRKARKSGSRNRRSAGRRASHRSSTRVVKQTIIKHIPAGGVVVAPPKHRRRKGRKADKRRSARRGHRRSSRRSGGRRSRGAMENPLTGTELFIGSVTGLVGFLAADALDRFLATHALTGTAAPYTDTPPTTGDYPGLMNATAVAAPMTMTRWGIGLLLAATPIAIAHFVPRPNLRAGLQFFGFAAGLRIAGKGLIDMTAQLLQNNQIGQQLYDGEMRANLLKQSSGQTSTALQALPSAGLGRPAQRLGAAAPPCGPCAANGAAAPKAGAGYPSMPVTPAGLQALTPGAPAAPTAPPANTTPPNPAAPTPPAATAPGGNTSGLTGSPRLGAARPPTNGAPRPRMNRFGWGAPE